MEAAASQIQRKLRDHRATAIAVTFAALTLLGVAPRNQRALFATLPFGTPEAFVAIVPPPSVVLFPGRGGGGPLGAFGYDTPPPAGAAPVVPGAPVIGNPALPQAPVATPVIPPTGPELASASTLPELIPGLPPPLPGGGGDVPGGSLGPVGPGVPGGPGPGGGGGGGGGGGEPAPAVPEPASWLMMISGVLFVGGMLRRAGGRRRIARATQP